MRSSKLAIAGLAIALAGFTATASAGKVLISVNNMSSVPFVLVKANTLYLIWKSGPVPGTKFYTHRIREIYPSYFGLTSRPDWRVTFVYKHPMLHYGTSTCKFTINAVSLMHKVKTICPGFKIISFPAKTGMSDVHGIKVLIKNH